MKSKIKESDIQLAILDYLNARGIFAWRNNTTGIYDPVKKVFRKSKSKYSINGVADILGVYKGRFLAIEVKRPSGAKASEDQMLFLARVNQSGGLAFIAKSIEDVSNGLLGLK